MEKEDKLQRVEPPDVNESKNLASPKIIGVDAEFVENFLILLRDNYERCDEAINFLEQNTGIASISSITNQRDALSHFVTALKPDLSDEERKQQFYNAEEHLRRAIIDPFQIACAEKYDELSSLSENYKKYVIPVREKYSELQSAPNNIAVNNSMNEITHLLSNARKAKGRNKGDEIWEGGVLSYIRAFEKIQQLHQALESYWYKYLQIRRDRKQTFLTIIGIALAVIGILLAVFFV